MDLKINFFFLVVDPGLQRQVDSDEPVPQVPLVINHGGP